MQNFDFNEALKAIQSGKPITGSDGGICQHSCHPYLNQATKTSVALIRLDGRTGLSAVG